MAGVQSYNRTSLVVRLKAAGDAVDYTALVPSGNVTALAVDQSGAAFVAGTGFLARIAPDGTAGFSTIAVQGRVTALAVDAGGNAELYSAEGFLRRFNSTGGVIFSKTAMSYGAMALDAAGNAYVTGPAPSPNPVANSLRADALLTVFGPDGSVLQNTYIPGAASTALPSIVASNSTVFSVACSFQLDRFCGGSRERKLRAHRDRADLRGQHRRDRAVAPLAQRERAGSFTGMSG